MTRKADEIVRACRERVASWDALERRDRSALDPADFAALRAAGYPLLVVPERFGGAWSDVRRMTRPIAEVVGDVAGVDPSLALVLTMHPAVLAYWLTTPEVPAIHRAAWEAQCERIFAGVVDGDWWGTITSEPGSGGDVMKTRTIARRADADADIWRLDGEKHFASGSGALSHMITTARPEGEDLPDLFVLPVAGLPWDGSRGLELAAAWDGHGMAATQSHAFHLAGAEAFRIACPMVALTGLDLAVASYLCTFTAVVAGVVRTALAEAERVLRPRADALRAYERVEWTRARNEGWLVEQGLEGMLRAVESRGDPLADALRGKTALAELAESVMTRVSRVVGGASFSRRAPFGTWGQDVRALGFLRPPWGLAFDQLFELEGR